MRRILVAALALALSFPAVAGELAGVTMPDADTVAGQQVVLNGMALREKYFLDIYVGGLYLPAKNSDSASVIAQDVPKKLVMSFIYSEVPAEKTIETYREIWDLDPSYAANKADADKFCSWITTMTSGQTMTIQYVPGTGTTLLVDGQAKGTIAGTAFMKLIFGNYVGPNANKVLRKGLLGQ
jgi:hypothetical protein